MFLVVGLGNPSKEYENNRHNVGFMAADALFRRYSFTDFKEKAQGLLADGTIADEKVLLLKPQTYMNLSGNSVGEVTRFYKIPTENILVLHDDLDLKPGTVRVKQGGGTGGHNGLKSIDAHVGNTYSRVRIGIGHPGDKAMVADYVLSDFTNAEKQQLNTLFDILADNLPLFIEKGTNAFATKIGEDIHGI